MHTLRSGNYLRCNCKIFRYCKKGSYGSMGIKWKQCKGRRSCASRRKPKRNTDRKASFSRHKPYATTSRERRNTSKGQPNPKSRKLPLGPFQRITLINLRIKNPNLLIHIVLC